MGKTAAILIGYPAEIKVVRNLSPKASVKKTGCKAGGQEGHQGHTLLFNPEPDLIETHRPAQCEHCQSLLAEDIAADDVAKRQVFDLPPLRFVTTEHQAETVLCPCCGEATTGAFPADVTNPVQYGTQVKRLAVYLRNEPFIPYERERQLMADLFELPISTGSLQNFLDTAAERVKPATKAIKDGGDAKRQRHVTWLNALTSTKLPFCVSSMILRYRLIITWLNETSE